MTRFTQPYPCTLASDALRTLRVGLCALCLLAQRTGAQAPPFDWATQAGGVEVDSAYAVAVDAEGCVAVTGHFYASAMLGTHVLTTTNGNGSFYVAKHDPTGQLLWAQGADGEGAAYDLHLAMDGGGAVYLTGLFHGVLRLGPHCLQTPNWRDLIFVVKFDRDGRLLWIQWADGVDPDSGHVSHVDAAGNVYVTGAFPWGAQFGPHTLAGRGGTDVFVAKYDPAGNLAWVEQAGGNDYDVGQALQVDAEGNVYVTGAFSGSAQFGGPSRFRQDSGGTNLVSAAGQDIFLAKYDRLGRLLWAAGGGGEVDDVYDRDIGSHLAVDGAGHVYLAGLFRDWAQIGPVTLQGWGLDNIFLAKFSPSGEVLWATNAQSEGSVFCHDLQVDFAGHACLTGSFEGTTTFGSQHLTSIAGTDLFLVRYDALGQTDWAVQANNEGCSDYLGHIGLDALGSIYLAGDCVGELTLGAQTLTQPGQSCFFVAKFDPSGSLLWTHLTNAATSGALFHEDMVVDRAGNAYVTGVFEGEVQFGQERLMSRGGRDVFLAKLSSGVDTPTIVTQPADRSACLGMSARFTITVAGRQPLVFQWFRDDVELADDGRVTGSQSSTLTLRQIQLDDAGHYHATIRNSSGQAASAEALLTVEPRLVPPIILAQPVSQRALRGEPVRLEVVADGSEPLSYQWQFEGADLPGATSATLVFSHVQLDQAGRYSVTISNAAGSVPSAEARLSVDEFISLTEALDDYGLVWLADRDGPWFGQSRVTHDGVDAAQCFVSIENSAWLETMVTGPGIISFRWKISVGEDASLSFQMDNDPGTCVGIGGETDWLRHSFLVPEGTHMMRWWTSRSEGNDGGQNSAWIDEVSFTTNAPAPPVIVEPLRSQAVDEGDDLLLTVAVEGTEPLSYEWVHRGDAWPEDYGAALVRTNVSPAQAGDYTVAVHNAWGAATSAPATVTVGPAVVGWEWTREVSVQGEIEGFCAAADEAGNAYVGGWFSGQVELESHPLWAPNYDIFVARFDRSGHLVWLQQAGSSSSDDAAIEMALDPAGNLVVYGFSNGNDLQFGALTLTLNDSAEHGFLARYSPAGEVLQVGQAASCDAWCERRMIMDRGGNIYIARDFWGELTLGGTVLQHHGNRDGFVAKYSTDFSLVWARSVGDQGYEWINDLAVDSLEQVYVAGMFGPNLALGTTLLTGPSAWDNPFWAKLDRDGNVLWAKAGEPSQVQAYNLAVDNADHLYLRSCFSGTLLLGTNQLDGGRGQSYFLAKYDAADNLLWARSGPGAAGYHRKHTRLAVDDADNVYFKGDFYGGAVLGGKFVWASGGNEAAFLAKHDPAGALVWLRCIGSSAEGSDRTAWGIAPNGAAVVVNGRAWRTRLQVACLGLPKPCLRVHNTHPGSSHGLRLTLEGLGGRCPAIIEMSADLITWEPVHTNVAPCQAFEFGVPLQPASPARFYRAVLP